MERDRRGEQELLESASRGDVRAVEELLVRHLGDLDLFVRRRASGLPRGKDSASDLVQSICLTVLVRLHDERLEYRGEAQFRAWLYEAAQLAIQERRRYWATDKRDPGRERRAPAEESGRSPEEHLPRRSPTPSEVVVLGEETERAQRLLAELPESYRRVIVLARVEGLSHRDVAQRMGITESASRMLLSRALRRLAHLAERIGRRARGAAGRLRPTD